MIKSSMQAQPTAEQANQLTAEPPRLYRAPKINLGDLPTLHKLVAQELMKISQSQSILLTLYEQMKAKSSFFVGAANSAPSADNMAVIRTNAGISLEPNQSAEPGTSLEIIAGEDDGGSVIALDFHINKSEPTNDYDVRIMAQAPTAGAGNGTLAEFCADHLYYGNVYGMTGMVANNYRYQDGARYFYTFPNGSVRPDAAGGGSQITNNMDYAPTNCSYFAYSAGTGVANGAPGEAAIMDWGTLSGGYRCQLAACYGNNSLYYRTQNGDNGNWNGWATIATAAGLKNTDHKLRLRIRKLEERFAALEGQSTNG